MQSKVTAAITGFLGGALVVSIPEEWRIPVLGALFALALGAHILSKWAPRAEPPQTFRSREAGRVPRPGVGSGRSSGSKV